MFPGDTEMENWSEIDYTNSALLKVSPMKLKLNLKDGQCAEK